MRNHNIIIACFIVGFAQLFIGCATMLKGNESALYLRNAPADLKVYHDNKELTITKMEDLSKYGFAQSFSDEMNKTQTTFYSFGVKITPPFDSKELLLKSKSSGKETKVKLESHLKMSYFWLDLFLTGPVGIVVDASNGNWNEPSGVGDEMSTLDVAKHFSK